MPIDSAQVRDVFIAALEKEEGTLRATYLDEACGGDEELRRQIDILLQAHQETGRFLEQGAIAAPPTVDQPKPERLGMRIGPYKLLQELGEGGMGVVYMAEQTEPVRRRVALKIIKPGLDTRQVIARFEVERQALSLMDHPNIARVLDAGTTVNGRPYFVMELVKGRPITHYCDEKRLTPRQRLELFVSICQAIQYAHQKGIIHRDVKPSNVLVAEYDGRPAAKVIDFGVAKAISQSLTEKTMFTGYGQIVGTLEYMSPEQASLNQLDIDTRSDIYSLGVLLYELLTGSTPVDKHRLRSAAWDEMLRIIREDEPPKPSTRLSESQDSLPSVSAQRHTEPAKLTKLVRGELDWIVMKALEKDRARRYETATGLASDIQRYLNDEPVAACPPSATYRLRKFARRNKAPLAISVAMTLLIVLVVGTIGWAFRDRAARIADAEREKTDHITRLTIQADVMFADVDRWIREEKWDEALASAKRLESLVQAGSPPADLLSRVAVLMKELAFVHRLKEIRDRRTLVTSGVFNRDGPDQEYAVAFREFVAVEESMPVEQCVAILQSHKRTLSPIIAAIDHWAFVRRRASLKSKNNWQKLIAISRRLDSDSVLNQFRSAWENDGVLESRQLLRELAEQVDVGHQHPSSLSFMFTVLRDAGYHSEAERLLVRSHLQYPDDFWITFNLGYTAPNNQDGVNCYYFVLPSLRPESGFSYNLVGFNLLEQGHVERAIPWLRRSIELAPDFVAPHLNLVRALVAQRKFDEATRARAEAIRVCQAGILHNPNSSGLHNDLGVLLKEQGQLDDAIACYRKSVELDPNLASAHRNLAFALARQGQLEEALTSLRTALKLVPNESTAAAQISSTIGQWESQVPLNKRFRAILKGDDQPQDNSERLAFAALAYQQHRHVVAARFFFEALTSDPTLADDRQAQHRYNAACAAALAGCDQPMDSPALEETTQARWRAQAREWLQLELAACAKLLESAKVMERAHISKMLHHWQADPDLAGVRDPERLTKLPQGEQRSFQQLWKSVAELIEQAESVAKLP